MIPWEEDIIIYNFVSCFFVRFKRFCNCPKLFGSLHVQSQTTQKQQRRPQGNLSMSKGSSIHPHSIIPAIIKTLERGQTQIKVFVPLTSLPPDADFEEPGGVRQHPLHGVHGILPQVQ